MSKRDKILLAVIGAVVLAGGYWMLLLSPKRKDLTRLDKQVADKQQQLNKATGATRPVQQRYNYSATYATLAKLGKAAPPAESVDDDVPALILQLGHAGGVTHTKVGLELASQGGSQGSASGGASGSSASGGPSQSAAGSASGANSPPTAGAAAPSATGAGSSAADATLTPLGARITYTGSFYNLEDVIHYLNGMTSIAGHKRLAVKGRLVTIRAIKFTVVQSDQQTSALAQGQSPAAQAALQAAIARNPIVKAEIFGNLYTLPAETSLFGAVSGTGDSSAPGTPAPASSAGGSGEGASTPAPPSATVRRP